MRKEKVDRIINEPHTLTMNERMNSKFENKKTVTLFEKVVNF